MGSGTGRRSTVTRGHQRPGGHSREKNPRKAPTAELHVFPPGTSSPLRKKGKRKETEAGREKKKQEAGAKEMLP